MYACIYGRLLVGLEAQLCVLSTSDDSSGSDGFGMIRDDSGGVWDHFGSTMDLREFISSSLRFAAVDTAKGRNKAPIAEDCTFGRWDKCGCLKKNHCHTMITVIDCLKYLEMITVSVPESVANSFSFSTRQDSRTIVRQPGLHGALLGAYTMQQQAPETSRNI